MTGLLKDALTERAAAEEAPHLDLDAIVRTGDRQLRRRRAIGSLAAVVTVTAVIAGGLAVFDRTAADAPPAGTAAPFAERKVTWAGGQTIHYGDRDIPVFGAIIDAFVQTDSGFVIADIDGRVWAADGTRVSLIGDGNQQRRLEAGERGSVVAWVDFSAPRPEFVVYDVAARRELLRTSEGNTKAVSPARLPQVVGIDGRYVYLGAVDGLIRYDTVSAARTRLEPGLAPDAVRDVTAGRFVVDRFRSQPNNLVVSDKLSDRAPRFDGQQADLSPGGTYVATRTLDAFRFYSVAQRRELTLRHPHHPVLGQVRWLDDDRVVVTGTRDRTTPAELAPYDVLTCTISSGDCHVTLTRPGAVDPASPDAGVQLPTGRRLADVN
jgi:hypothetical protein